MDPLTLLFDTKTAKADVVRVVQVDADSIDLSINENVARLNPLQFVALVTEVAFANVGMLMHYAETLDDETCAVLGQAFLYPASLRAVKRAQTTGAEAEAL